MGVKTDYNMGAPNDGGADIGVINLGSIPQGPQFGDQMGLKL